MTGSITEAQAKWASGHDWYRGYRNGRVYVACWAMGFRSTRTFGDLASLRQWAGY